jgi:hypothetical protein
LGDGKSKFCITENFCWHTLMGAKGEGALYRDLTVLYVYIYTHTHTRTYIHTYTHTASSCLIGQQSDRLAVILLG